MTQQKTLRRKIRFGILTTGNAFTVLFFAATLMVPPLLARAQTPSRSTAPAAGTASAKATAPARETAPPPASEEVPLPQSHVPAFAKVDSNHDGKIEWKEAKAVGVPKKLFKQDDFRQDGKLTKSEWHFVRLEMHTPGNSPARMMSG